MTGIRNKGYRHLSASAQLEVDLPIQIRAYRKQKGLTRPKPADLADMGVSRIKAMEEPGGASFSLETLCRLAEAFDVALIVRFRSFDELAERSIEFSPDDFAVARTSESKL